MEIFSCARDGGWRTLGYVFSNRLVGCPLRRICMSNIKKTEMLSLKITTYDFTVTTWHEIISVQTLLIRIVFLFTPFKYDTTQQTEVINTLHIIITNSGLHICYKLAKMPQENK